MILDKQTKTIYERLEKDYPLLFKSAYSEIASYAKSHIISCRSDCSLGEAILEATLMIAPKVNQNFIDILNTTVLNKISEFLDSDQIAYDIKISSKEVFFWIYVKDKSDSDKLNKDEANAFLGNLSKELSMPFIGLSLHKYAEDNIGHIAHLSILP